MWPIFQFDAASMTHNKVLIKSCFTVLNEKGLHTRPSTELVKCVSGFKSDVTLSYQDMSVNGKSLLGILLLAAHRGAKIQIEARGEDAEACVEAILALSKEKFHLNY